MLLSHFLVTVLEILSVNITIGNIFINMIEKKYSLSFLKNEQT